ncbi:MAG: NPCBM/NEW2 domain-containing protein [Fimbriimonas sp.]|nr:NPCBM/NEW2 domain-containing protein [Fimbriimonas sp.]
MKSVKPIVGLAILVLAVVAEASARRPGEWVPLSRFPLVSAEQGWGTLGMDRTVQGHPLLIGKRAVAGYGTHAPGRLSFALGGHCDRFRVALDVDREVAYTKKGSIDFSILGDGRTLYRSGVQHVLDPNLPLPVTVDVRGVDVLELVCGDGGDGLDSDHADWLRPEVTLAASNRTEAQGRYRVVQSGGLSIRVSHEGEIVAMKLVGDRDYRRICASTELVGSRLTGRPQVRRLADGGFEVKKATAVQGRVCLIVERFRPTRAGIKWQFEARAEGAAFSSPITTSLTASEPQPMKVWMPWNDPFDPHLGLGIGESKTDWNDPLVPQPFQDRLLSYGETPNTNWWTGDIVTLPMVSLFDSAHDRALTLIQSPDDLLPAAVVSTGRGGSAAISRVNRRLGGGSTVLYTMLLASHAADPKAALAAFVHQYPAFMFPTNPKVAAFSGTAAYSGDERTLDSAAIERLKAMDFKSMWKLSDDYSCMGLFIPPVTSSDERWQRIDDSGSPAGYKPIWTSARRLNDFGAMLRSGGFHLLSYFNVIEFGHDLKPVTTPEDPKTPDLWKDPSSYLAAKFPSAVLRPDGKNPEGAWQGGWAMDPGDPGYRDHLLEQADRHIRWLPDSEGVCIDRVDYMCQYNDGADDGVTWHRGHPARALVTSWMALMDQLGPKLHHAGKVIFANLMDPRPDIARRIDGVYAEFGNQPTVVNGLAFLCLEKPLLAWTRNEDELSDRFFQRHLYLGAFPTAPYPTNNHCIQPSPERDRWYLDYGHLFQALNGRRWVLQPHAVTVSGRAKANLFAVEGGYAVPVTFAGTAKSVKVSLARLPNIGPRSQFEAWLPGRPTPLPIQAKFGPTRVEFQCPVDRGCAVVAVRR